MAIDTRSNNVYQIPGFSSIRLKKDGLHNGRAKNGMFIAIPMEFKKFAKEVNTFNWRTQALTLTFPEKKNYDHQFIFSDRPES